MEAVSFDDTLGELQEVFGEDLKEDQTIPVYSERMYEVIANFCNGLESDWTARVDTKYKTLDRKVRPVANNRGCVGPEFARSGQHRTHVHRYNATRAQDRWG